MISLIVTNLRGKLVLITFHYARFAHHCRHHHGSDVPPLPVMSLKMKKMIGAGLKPAVKDHITASYELENEKND
jgi:hypothetical protein